jgi:hypothetical protein
MEGAERRRLAPLHRVRLEALANARLETARAGHTMLARLSSSAWRLARGSERRGYQRSPICDFELVALAQ